MSRYRFSANIGGVFTELSPLGYDKLAKQWNKENDQEYYREEISGDLVFKGADFLALYAHEVSPNKCEAVPFMIERSCSGDWINIYTGQLLMTDGEWDVDSCTLKIKAAKIDDYSCLTKNWGEKINMLSLGFSTKTVKPVIGTIEEVSYVDSNTDFTSLSIPLWGGAGVPADAGWVIEKNILDFDGTMYSVTTYWVREVVTVPDTELLGIPWILISTGTGTKTYARPAVLYNYREAGNTSLGVASYEWDVMGQVGAFPSFDNGVHLRDILTYMADTACPGLFVVSDFFQINPENPSTTNYVTGALSKVMDLLFFQKSDIKRADASQNATKAEFSLEELLNVLKTLFNTRYKIVGNSLRIEHYSYFNSALGLDLTQPMYSKYVRGKHKYSYDKNKMPKYEKFKLRQATYPDFIGKDIYYDSLCVNQDPKSNVANYTSDVFITDLQSVLDQMSDTEDLDGIVIVAAQAHSTDYILQYETGILGGPKPNNVLAFAQLHRDYHMHGRILFFGNMNGAATGFFSVIKTKKGEKITIPLCCSDNFSADEMVTTMIGMGEVDQASFNFKGETLDLTLFYDA